MAALLSSRPFWSQQDLAAALRKRDGIAVTQATLSRDLTELGVVKGPNGYMLPSMVPGLVPGTLPVPHPRTAPGAQPPLTTALTSALRLHFVSATRGGTLVVVRTPAGHANSLAVELDRAGLPGVLGTIAGDDTIFLACQDNAAATTLTRTLERMARSTTAGARGGTAA